MGVYLECQTPTGKRLNITPGWRSKMFTLLDREGLIGYVTAADVSRLVRIARHQMRGEVRKPFDWAFDIGLNILRIAREAKRHGSVLVRAEW